MDRIYSTLIKDSLKENRQMLLLSGARQVGKTTITKDVLKDARYFNYDISADALLINSGTEKIAESLDLANPLNFQKGVIFDELHKYPKWKSLLKGFFDLYGDKMDILVTGSAKMDTYKRGGDSLMGRYFSYRVHPLSPRELCTSAVSFEQLFQKSVDLDEHCLSRLLNFGGFPEPLLKASPRFYNRWKSTRLEQVFNEDIRDLTRVQDIKQIRALAILLESSVGSGVNYSSLSNELNVTSDTIKSWISILESLYYVYTIRPYFKNVANSIRKQPKVYLWDWSMLKDEGAKNENFLASLLLKSVDFWTDSGLGNFELFYLRDKSQREVDFLVLKDDEPWMLVECKSSSKESLSPQLKHYQDLLKCTYAYQICFDLPQSSLDPLKYTTPIKLSILDLAKVLV
ncbi:MAG: ATP-binding protein [Akkermansia sp.]